MSTGQFRCADPSARADSLSYVLTREQYVNTLEDLFGKRVIDKVSNELSALPSDTFDGDTHQRVSALTEGKLQAYLEVAQGIATAVIASNTATASVFGACATAAAPPASCVDTYLETFATRIFRRPLTSREVAVARQMVGATGTFKDNLAALLSLHLQSPHFIWRVEVGKPTQTSTRHIELTGHEVATRIAYMVTDSTPDPALLDAARSGQLTSLSGVQVHVSRLLQSPRGKAKTRKNLMRWSLSESLADVTSLPDSLKKGIQIAGLEQGLTEEIERYIDYMVYDQKASFADLLTSRASFAKHLGAAAIYGHPPVTGATPAMFTGRRQGLLMRAPFLLGSLARTPIIHRGVDFQKRILCNEIPSPTADIADQRTVDVLSADKLSMTTTRHAVAHQTASALCMSCHKTINPTGFAFEGFDPLGRLRTAESIFDGSGRYLRSLPVDTRAVIPLAGGASVEVADAYDLVKFVGTSGEGTSCFSRHILRYVVEREEVAADSCQLAAIQNAAAAPDRPVLDAIAATLAHPSVLFKIKE